VLAGQTFGSSALSLCDGVDRLKVLIAGDHKDLRRLRKLGLKRNKRASGSQWKRNDTVEGLF
jgi:hypothetical protein